MNQGRYDALLDALADNNRLLSALLQEAEAAVVQRQAMIGLLRSVADELTLVPLVPLEPLVSKPAKPGKQPAVGVKVK